MSPKAVNFRAGNVIYMKGFNNSYVYILKSGVVSLNSQDIQTGLEDQDQIRTGELFGVKSALGSYPTDEQALALVDSTVLAFTVEEFEQVASSNTRIIMKMLKVYSNQLRRIHRQVQNLLSSGDNQDPEEGLYNIGLYYHNNGKYRQSVASFKRYLLHYPEGRFIKEADKKILYGEPFVDSPGSLPPEPDGGVDFSEAMNLYEKGEFRKALKAFSIICDEGSEHSPEATLRLGISLFRLGRNSDACVKLSQFIKGNGAHSLVPEALFYIGECYKANRNSEKAISFYKKALAMSSPSDQIYVLLTENLQSLEGNK